MYNEYINLIFIYLYFKKTRYFLGFLFIIKILFRKNHLKTSNVSRETLHLLYIELVR